MSESARLKDSNQRGRLQPDLEQTKAFLTALTGEDRPVVTFQTFDDSGEPKDPRLSRILHGTLDQHCKELTKLNNAGAGAYVMVNQGDCKGRTKENVVSVRAIFVDLDGAPVEPVRDAPAKPNLIVESSPGRYHAYWKVFDCPLEKFGAMQKALAEKFNGDASVSDLPRVMRLPGFFHRKAAPFMTVLET